MSILNIKYVKNCFGAICVMFYCTIANTQSPEYALESFQGETYTELTSFQSIRLLTNGNPFWEYEFQLEFPFPFYDSIYTRILYSRSWGSFTDDQDPSLLLMEYRWDTSKSPSDVRFSHVMIGSQKAFVMEYNSIRIFGDPFADSLNTYLNFQYKFYEDGVIEVHFGDIHMDNSPLYSKGDGIYCFSLGVIDTTEVCGPHMGIGHPLLEDYGIGLEGAYNDYEVYPDQYGFLTEFPPPGWVIRFKPTFISTTRIEKSFQEVVLSPNPTTDYINLPAIATNISIYDGTGKLVFMQIQEGKEVDASTLSAGIHYIHFISEGRQFAGKFVRQ
jgi:hypothetical protein